MLCGVCFALFGVDLPGIRTGMTQCIKLDLIGGDCVTHKLFTAVSVFVFVSF